MTPSAAVAAPSGNPYVGPRRFGRNDAGNLFGRDRETREAVSLLVSERIVLLHSPSGAGKTSLIEARLRPEPERRRFDVLPTVRVFDGTAADDRDRPPTRYILSVRRSLDRLASSDSDGFPANRSGVADAGFDGVELKDLLHGFREIDDSQAVATDGSVASGLPKRPRPLIFDRFEEILTLDPTDADAKHEFFRQVGAVLRAGAGALSDEDELPLGSGPVWAVFSMRGKFVAAFQPSCIIFRRSFPSDTGSNRCVGRRRSRPSASRPRAAA